MAATVLKKAGSYAAVFHFTKYLRHIPHHYRNYGIYEPTYLEAMKSKIPLHNTLNIQINGYDFSILESYQSLIHRFASYMDVDVEDGWATPAKHLQIKRYKPHSTVTDTEYKLVIYERNVQVSAVESTTLPILLQILVAALPEGVALQVHEHQPEHEEIRYIPDHDLLALKDELETITQKKK